MWSTPLPKNQDAIIGRYPPIRQRLQPKTQRLFRNHPSIAHSHARIEAAQVVIEGGIAGCRGHAIAKEGAVEQQ